MQNNAKRVAILMFEASIDKDFVSDFSSWISLQPSVASIGASLCDIHVGRNCGNGDLSVCMLFLSNVNISSRYSILSSATIKK